MSTMLSRRNMLKMQLGTLACVSTLGLTNTLKAHAAPANGAPRTLDEVASMSIEDIALSSEKVLSAWTYLSEISNQISDPYTRLTVLKILSNPAPTLLEAGNEKAILAELKAKKLIDENRTSLFPYSKISSKSEQPFYTATGSGWGSHHAYPGGLATHTALNVKMCLAMHANYVSTYDCTPSRDCVITAQVLHDLHKPWVFQWQKNKQCRKEEVLANTGEHHVLSIAESIHRKLAPNFIIAQASAHMHAGNPAGEASVVSWLKAASIIVGVDPVSYGLLAKGEATLPLPRITEGFITHVADHDYVLSVPALQWLLPVLEGIAMEHYGMSKKDLDGPVYAQFRNFIFAQISAMTLYQEYANKKEDGVKDIIFGLIKKTA